MTSTATSTSTPTATSTATATSISTPRGSIGGLIILVALAFPVAAVAVPGNRSVALETVLAGQGGGGSPAFTLAAGCWLEWELEALARLTVGSAPRPEGRGAAGAVTPEVGLRWAPDQGRWKPVAAAAVGVRLPTAGRATAATLLLQGGVERGLGSGWAAVATAGVRWLAGERAAAEAALGVRLAF
jgi:hypothetical protein